MPELASAFSEEFAFLRAKVDPTSVVLDVGCGAGRPATSLALLVQKIIGIDNDSSMLDEAARRCKEYANIQLVMQDALNMALSDNTFDLTYAAYNVIGSIAEESRPMLIREMARVTRDGGKVVNITWKTDSRTTDFLRRYYPHIGLDLLEITETRAVTPKGFFDRIPPRELVTLYRQAGLENVHTESIGDTWLACCGIK